MKKLKPVTLGELLREQRNRSGWPQERIHNLQAVETEAGLKILRIKSATAGNDRRAKDQSVPDGELMKPMKINRG